MMPATPAIHMAQTIAAATAVESYTIAVRRDLHQMPEVRWEEEKTLAYILGEVKNMNSSSGSTDKFFITVAKGGLMVDYIVNQSDTNRQCLLFRADVDALPIQEETGLPFASKIPGKMHACGHDMHAAMLLGAMKAISNGLIEPKHNIRFVFQRAEENPTTLSGGKSLVDEGVLDGVAEAHALHIWATGEKGVFLSRAGRMCANSDRIKVTIKTSGGHVAFPNKGVSAVDVGVDVVASMRNLATRALSPNEPVSLVPAVFKSGTGSNIMPSDAELWFACRNYLSPVERTWFHGYVNQHVQSVALQYPSTKAEVEVIRGHPMMLNSTNVYDADRQLILDAGMKVGDIEPSLGGEDFAWYLEAQGGVKGCMWMLGAEQKGGGDHHQPTFNPSEDVLWQGVAFWLMQAIKTIK